MSILIADSGASKTDWLYLKGEDPRFLTTPGLNPNVVNEAFIQSTLFHQVLPWLGENTVRDLLFFGAGLGRPVPIARMESLLQEHLPLSGRLSVQSDLVGAAYACLGDEPGVVGILGTGSAAFRYDGALVVARRGGRGYLIGDEGSGADLGKHLLRMMLSRSLPAQVAEDYRQTYGLAPNAIPDVLYRHDQPNIFLASQAPFIAAHLACEPMRDMVIQRLDMFLERCLQPLIENEQETVCFTGGIARSFASILETLCRQRGLHHLEIMKQPPIEAMARHLIHQSRL